MATKSPGITPSSFMSDVYVPRTLSKTEALKVLEINRTEIVKFFIDYDSLVIIQAIH
jgi:hypothetical protein